MELRLIASISNLFKSIIVQNLKELTLLLTLVLFDYEFQKIKKVKTIITIEFQPLWCGAGSNRRHKDFQSFALPTELPHHLFPFGAANIGANY